MTDLWKQILDNLAFVGVSLAIVVGLALLARLAEHFLPEKRKVSPARRVSIQITAGQTAYICHQVGVYGKLDTGPDETLLMVVQDDRGVEIPAASTSDPATMVDTAATRNLRLVNRRGCQYDANASTVSVRPPTTALASRVHRYT